MKLLLTVFPYVNGDAALRQPQCYAIFQLIVSAFGPQIHRLGPLHPYKHTNKQEKPRVLPEQHQTDVSDRLVNVVERFTTQKKSEAEASQPPYVEIGDSSQAKST